MRDDFADDVMFLMGALAFGVIIYIVASANNWGRVPTLLASAVSTAFLIFIFELLAGNE